jgi:hypothetical protein
MKMMLGGLTVFSAARDREAPKKTAPPTVPPRVCSILRRVIPAIDSPSTAFRRFGSKNPQAFA